MIKLNNITKVFGKENSDNKTIAIRNISLEINDGEMVGIIGPSGSGKTTLLNIIGCLDLPTSGEYFLNDKSVISYSSKELSKLRNSVFGFIMQDFALIDTYTVFQNVCLPIRYNKNISVKDKNKSIIDLLQQLGIYEKINAYPQTLSGGQKQRVAIARALINNPQIILADEPTGSLDQENGQAFIRLLKEINKTGKTIIIITHDMGIASQCQRTIKIVDGMVK